MAHTVHNERVKLLANALNTMGIAVMVTGTVAPMIGTLYGTLAIIPRWWLLAMAFGCLSAGVGLHVVAQSVLGGLRDG